MDLKARDVSQDALIHATQKLRRLLDKAQQYWTTDWQDAPVYIEAKASMETNTRYALISQGSLQVDDNYYAQPFLQPGCVAAMDEMLLVMERGHWTGNVPGTSTALTLNTEHFYNYNAWEIVDTLGAGTWDVVDQLACVDDNFHLYALDGGDVYRSVDKGDTWALRYNYGGTAYCIAAAPNGDLWLGGVNAGGQSEVLKSTDAGLTFNAQDALATHDRVYNIRVVDNNNILAWHYDAGGVDVSLLRHTANAGGAWTTVITAATKVLAMSASVGAYAVAVEKTAGLTVYTSSDSGLTWIKGNQWMTTLYNVIGIPDSTPETFIILTAGQSKGVGLGYYGGIYISYDRGITWAYYDHTSTWPLLNVAFDSNGIMYGVAEGDVGVSYLPSVYTSSDGVQWTFEQTVGTGVDNQPADILCTTDDDTVIVIEEDDTWNRGAVYTLGMEDSTTGHYISNLYRTQNLTHIKVFENGVGYTDVIGTAPYNLFPDPISAGDCVYFGFATDVIPAPWQSLVFDLSAVMIADTYTLDWEYWVAAWETLTVVDNTGPADNAFSYLGINSVHWEFPSDWAITTIDGIDAYWMKADLVSVTNMTVVPAQQTRDVYSISYPFVDIDAASLTGDITCLARTALAAISANYGPEGIAVRLYENNMMLASRSISRGERFSAYLNVSRRQNTDAIIVSSSGSTTIALSKIAPSGYRGVYNPTGLEDWADQITFTIATSAASEFVGSYHAFLRCQEYDAANDPGNISVRLKVSATHGGIANFTSSQQCLTINDYTVLDFGKISIPVGSALESDQVVDRSTIIIQCKADSNNTDMYLYDLILMPVDEMIVHANTNEDNTYSFNYGKNGLIIDSVKGKPGLRAFVQDSFSFVRAIYATDGQGLYLKPNASQRLWHFAKSYYVAIGIDDSGANNKPYLQDASGDFLRRGVKPGMILVNVYNDTSNIITEVTATRIYAGDDNDDGDGAYVITDTWVSKPEICHLVTMGINPRYLAARGNR